MKKKKSDEKKSTEKSKEEKFKNPLEKEKEKEAAKEKLDEIEMEEEKKKEVEGVKEGVESGEKEIVSFASEPVVEFLFDDILASRFGEDWILKEKELKSLSKATDELLLAYAEWLSKHAAKINFVLCLFMIIKPRIESAKKRREAEREKSGKEKK